jgi:hypothetical protein
MPLKKIQNPLVWAALSLFVFVGFGGAAEETSFQPSVGKGARPGQAQHHFHSRGRPWLRRPGCYGQKKIKTPNLDRMAAEGMRFTQCYAGSTVCAPSRSSLLTGQHTGHTRIRGNQAYPLKAEDITVAEVLKEAGFKNRRVRKMGDGASRTTGTPMPPGLSRNGSAT